MYANENYSVELVTSNSVMGTYNKYEAGPILTKINGVTSGPGHCSFVKDRNNHLLCVYHIHMNLNNPSGGRRAVFSKASFNDG